MATISPEIFQEVLSAYAWGEGTLSYNSYGEGHINNTYLVTVNGKTVTRYILQRINTDIFTDPKSLMENICGVTSYLRDLISKRGGDVSRETMSIVPTKTGSSYYTDSTGGAWRVYNFVENTICLQQCRNTEDFYTSARAFGQFQKNLADYDASSLHETIPNFHNTPDRLEKFKKAVAEDICGRAASVQKEIDFILEREELTHALYDLQLDGRLPLRVTHNDTKLNNIMIDDETGKAICVIDLDTVMPGLTANDFGDSIRFGASTALEDEQDLSKVSCDLHLFDVYARGFIEGCGGALTDLEIDMLPMGAILMTFENGIRFLTDHLEGDHYFHIHREGHNLDRCRTQLTLVKDMQEKLPQMNAIIQKYK